MPKSSMPGGGKRVIHTIPELCTGCLMCELICSLTKTGSLNPYLARVRVSQISGDHSWTPALCRHCSVPLCQKACPVPEAMTWDERLGVVLVNQSSCIGCLACVDACPFAAIYVGPNREILKCDLCGGDPMCVKFCPPRPENNLPHLPLPKQSCLQYVEPHKVNLHRFTATRTRGKGIQLPRAELVRTYQLAPQFAQRADRYKRG